MPTKPLFYLSGPMSGIPEYNYPAFHQAKEFLLSQGYKVRSPHDIDSFLDSGEKAAAEKMDEREKWAFYMRHAIRMQLDCTSWVGLPGWTHSTGARREFDIALDLKQETFLFDPRADVLGEPFLIRLH